MDTNIKKLINDFKLISTKGWIESVSNSFGSVGLTFEKQLSKNPDSLYFPDYYGIEIKCSTINSKYPIYLFTAAFDGPTFPEIDRIVKKYGSYDYIYKDKKTLFTKLSFTSKTLVNNQWYFKLSLDKKEEKIFLEVFDLKKNLIERKSFIYVLTIYNHLMIKLQKLAIIYALQKKTNNKKFFHYYKVYIYKLQSFDRFISLLTKGFIEISLISRIGKSGKDAGRYRNKNLVFAINKELIFYLFDRIYYYNEQTSKEIINTNV